MKLTLERDALQTALSRVGAIARRNSIPILSHVLLDATTGKKGGLALTATDTTIQAIIAVPAAIETAGRITVSAATLSDIAKNLPEGAQIKCEVVEGRLHVSAGRARWKLPMLDPVAFPLMESESWAWEQTLTGSILADTISRVSWAVCNDEGRPFLNGVNVRIQNGELQATASQVRDAATARMDCEGASDFKGVTIPTATCQEIVRLCAELPEVTLRLSETKVGVTAPGAALVSKVIGETYFDVDRVFSIKGSDAFRVDRGALASACRRAMIGAEASALGHGVRLAIEPGLLRITGRSPHSEAADEVEVEGYDGAEHALAFNAESMIAALGCLKSDTATIRFKAGEAMMPLHVSVEDDESVTCVCAPQKAA